MRKLFLVTIIFAFPVISAFSQVRWNSAYQTYIDLYKDLAIEEMIRYKIPASITLAQGLLESAAGRSELARKGNNHFGIKCHGWTGRKTYHDDDESNECFRAYENVAQSFEDHSKFLARQNRYSRLFKLSIKDYKGWAKGLKACGYATNPRYADKLIEIIELYELHKYDNANHYDKFISKHSSTGNTSLGRLHPIYKYNKNYYIIARAGDTFKSIGEEINISYKKIAKYNERDRNDKLIPGEVIFLKEKQKKADKAFKNRFHIVKAGESMYSISQYYGIRLKYLYKKNNLDANYQIKVGDKLLVY